MEEQELKEQCENCAEAIENKPADVDEGQVAEKSYQEVIEEARTGIYQDYSKSRKKSNILMFGLVAVIAGIMFMIVSENQVLQIIGYVLVALLFIGLIIYYVLNRKKFPDKTKKYVELVADKLNGRMFEDKHFSDMVFEREKKLEVVDLVGDGIYAEAVNINSRNVVRGVYKGHHFAYGEAALLRTMNRKKPLPPLFVGHYVSMPNDLQFDGRYIVVLKSFQEPNDLPNAVGDLVVLEEKENLIIYGPEGGEYQKVLGDKFLKRIKKLNVTNHLLNVNIAIWGGRFAAYLSYDDAVMSVPFDKPLNAEAFEDACGNLKIILQAFAGE